MNVQILRIWTHEQVSEYLCEALSLVEAVAPPEDLRAAVFGAAVQLCSQHVTAMPEPMPPALAGLTLPGGGR